MEHGKLVYEFITKVYEDGYTEHIDTLVTTTDTRESSNYPYTEKLIDIRLVSTKVFQQLLVLSEIRRLWLCGELESIPIGIEKAIGNISQLTGVSTDLLKSRLTKQLVITNDQLAVILNYWLTDSPLWDIKTLLLDYNESQCKEDIISWDRYLINKAAINNFFECPQIKFVLNNGLVYDPTKF